jgi:transposase
MAKLENVSIEELEAALDEVETKQETQRLMVAILYKRGPSVPMIAEWFDMRDDTIYSWFARLEERPIQDAITDDHRSGRPPKLNESAFETFESAVNEPPAESGYEQPAWSTALAQRFLREEFDVEYSYRHVRRLLKQAGLSHQTLRPQPPTADEDEREQFWGSIKKSH